MRTALARFVDHPLRIGIRLRHNFLITLLCLSEFLSDFLRVKLAFFDLSPPIFEHGQDRFVSELAKQNHDDAKANNLGQKKLPLPAERIGGIAQRLGKTSRSSSDHRIHKIKLMHAGNSPGPLKWLVTEQEQRVEHDGLGERDGENSVH